MWHIGVGAWTLGGADEDPDLFEVIVVLNGAPDGSRELVTEHAAAHPRITWRVVEPPDHPGVGRARNAGHRVGPPHFIALVDDDDTITPNYLDALYAHAEWDVVPMAWLDDVSPDGDVESPERTVQPHPAPVRRTTLGGLGEASVLLSLNAASPAAPLVRRVGHDTELRSGVDVEVPDPPLRRRTLPDARPAP